MSVMNIPLRLAAVLAISSLMLLAGCGEQAKIALPDPSLESDVLPSIDISALVEEGSADKPTINSASGANPETPIKAATHRKDWGSLAARPILPTPAWQVRGGKRT